MTVSTAMIALVSPYTVGASGDFTEADFTSYKTIGTAILSKDAPTDLDSDVYDYCHALLICHLFESSKGNVGMESEKIGDYSYKKGNPDETTFWTLYKAMINQFTDYAGEDSGDYDAVTRADTEMGDLDLDQNDVFEVERDWED